MNIKIDNEYTIQSDERNIILVRSKEAQRGKNQEKFILKM